MIPTAIQAAQFKFTDRFAQANGALRGPWTGPGVNEWTVTSGKAAIASSATGRFSTIKVPTAHNYVSVTYDAFSFSGGSAAIYVHETCSATAPTGAGSLFLQADLSVANQVGTITLVFFDGATLHTLSTFSGPFGAPLTLGLGWDGVSSSCFVNINGSTSTQSLGGFTPSGSGCGFHAAVSGGGSASVTATDFHAVTCDGYANLPA